MLAIHVLCSLGALLCGETHPPAPGPQQALWAMRPRAGFEIELVVSEPLVMDPIDLAWGPDGKLWVVEMTDYPLGVDGNLKPGGRVRYLEDTDSDGRYDRSTVFLEDLRFPSAVMPWREGALVVSEPFLFYAEDTDGDGRADLRTTLYEGFGGTLPQRRVNYPRLGLDNWIYFGNGASRGAVRSLKTGQVVDFTRSDVRFKPDEGLIEGLLGKTQWGRSRDDWGNWFGNNNSDPGFSFPLVERYVRRNPHVISPAANVDLTPARDVFPIGPVITHCYVSQPTPPRGQPGRWTSLCGATIYRDDLFGPEFHGNYFVNDSVYNCVHRMIVEPSGVTFHGSRAADERHSEFLGSLDPWFRPTSSRTGPDGALWVVDMCRIVIEHPEFIDDELEKTLDLREGHQLGRIWRIYPKNTTLRPIPRIDRLDTPALVAALDTANGCLRDMVQQLLVWRADRRAVRPLVEMATGSLRPQARLHALCTLDGLSALTPAVVLAALGDRHPGVRRHAVRLSEPLLNAEPELGPRLLELADDPDPQIQMQVAYSLGFWDDPRSGRALGRLAVRHLDDPYMSAAVMSSVIGRLEPIVAEVLAGADSIEDRAALIGMLLNVAVAVDDRESIAAVLEPAIDAGPQGYKAWQYNLVAELLDGLDRRKTPLAKLAAEDQGPLGAAIRETAAVFADARRLAVDETASVDDRICAVRILGRGPDRGEDDILDLCDLLVPQTPVELQLAVVGSAGRLPGDLLPSLLLDSWSALGPKVQAAALDALLRRGPWTVMLLDAAETRPEVAAAIDAARRERLLRHPTESIRLRAEELLGADSTSDEILKVLDEFKSVVDLPGDPKRGREVFSEATCADCHRLADVGKQIATDLGTLVDKSPGGLLTSTLDPNRAVENKFIEYIALTTDGLTISGMIFEETGNSITLADTGGELHVIFRKDVEELVSTGRSHMPEGLQGKLTPESAADLFAFIAQSTRAWKEFDGNRPTLVRASNDGSLLLPASVAEIYGPEIEFDGLRRCLTNWTNEEAYAAWSIEVPQPGGYEIWLDWACDTAAAQNRFKVTAGDAELVGMVRGTSTWDDYRRAPFGRVELAVGPCRIGFHSDRRFAGQLINLRSIMLVPSVAGQ